MNRSRFTFQKAFFALLLSGAWLLCAPAMAQGNNVQTGVIEGTLVDKGQAWIAVRDDDSGQAARFIPLWIGGLPKMGGGPDKRMLALFQELRIGMRLKVTWLYENQLHVVSLQVLQPREGENKAAEKSEQTQSGLTTGVVTGKGKDWISVRADGERESTKLIPRWIGGQPKDGGGFDKQMLQTIAQTPVGARVQVEWVFQERLRVVSLRRAQ